MQRTRARGIAVAGVAALAGLGIGVSFAPGAASAATSIPSVTTQAVGNRVTEIKDELAGLVKDGTITQAQADKVATTLDQKLPKGGGHRGFAGRGAALETAAGVIGISVDDLRTQLQGGKTLAQVAQGKGIDQATLVDKLVAAGKTRIADAVKAGRITQAQADRMTADLKDRVTREVTRTQGPGERGGWGGHRAGAPGAPGQTEPSSPSAPGGGTTAPSSAPSA